MILGARDPTAERSAGKLAMRGASYFRVSSELQRYSIDNQVAVNTAYAVAHGIEIVRTYKDEAKSGLSLAGRPALVQLLQDVLSGNANFETILVYDVSRWGRFQDADESAHYEYLCRSAGVGVRYCAEPFENEEGIPKDLFKVLKRAMAAEYVRELSAKTAVGLRRTAQLGYHVCGSAPFGLQRMLIGADGQIVRLLAPGEQKYLKTQRVKLVPGTDQEVSTVKRVFDLFVHQRLSEESIAGLLNKEAVPVAPSGTWSRARIHKMLSNEIYVGTNVYNRTTQHLRSNPRSNPPELWVRTEKAVEPIIDAQTFDHAQRLIRDRWRNKSDQEVLAALAAFAAKTGRLTKRKIERSNEVPHPIAFTKRFGGLLKAYQLIGHPPPKLGLLRFDPNIKAAFAELEAGVRATIFDTNSRLDVVKPRIFRINDQFTLRLAVATSTMDSHGHRIWRLLRSSYLVCDVTLAARLNDKNTEILDYYFIPKIAFTNVTFGLGHRCDPSHLEFRSPTLRPLVSLCILASLGRAFPKERGQFVSTVLDRG